MEDQPNPSTEGLGIEENPTARNMAMLCHILALAGFLIPFGNIIGPLVLWLIKREEFPFVDDQGKESVNFQITVSIAAIISMILTMIFIGFLLLLIVAIGSLVLIIIAALESSKGKAYRYPFCLRLIR